MPTQIEQLASQKNFQELSPAECALVLAEMPQEAYEQLHQLLQASRQLETASVPPARLRTHLMAAMAEKATPTGVQRFLKTRVPVWQASAVLILGVATAMLFKREVVVEKTVTSWLTRVDTVTLEKVVWRDRIVVKNKVVYREKTLAVPMATATQLIENQINVPDFNTETIKQPHIGTSLGDTPELMGFFTGQ